MSTEPTQLKPCLSCGSNNVSYCSDWKLNDRERDDSQFRSPSIGCDDCGFVMQGDSFGRGVSDEVAQRHTVGKWNTRPAWDALQAKVVRLRATIRSNYLKYADAISVIKKQLKKYERAGYGSPGRCNAVCEINTITDAAIKLFEATT